MSESNDGKLSLDDAAPLLEQFKPRARELLKKIDPEVYQEGQELAIDIAAAAGLRLSKKGLRMIIDRLRGTFSP